MTHLLSEEASETTTLVLFDGSCDICTWWARWVRAQDRSGRLRVIPNQSPGCLARHGLTREQVDRSVWTVRPNGERADAAAAVNVVLAELGPPWRQLARTLGWWPWFGVETAVYHWVARHRPLLSRLWSARPECDEPDVECQ